METKPVAEASRRPSEESTQLAINRRVKEVQKDLTFQFQPAAFQQLYVELVALAVRVQALEEEFTKMKGGK
jgi:hypothetical protein